MVQGCEAKEEVSWIGDGGGSVSLTKSTSTEHRDTFLPTERKSKASYRAAFNGACEAKQRHENPKGNDYISSIHQSGEAYSEHIPHI